MQTTTNLNAIINGYRSLISERYQFDTLSKKYPETASFGEQKINQFRFFFLEYIYPHPNRRSELNEAFEHLDSYIQKPEKLLRILLDSASLIWKYGRHLPKILRTGLQALRSFRMGNQFEQQLLIQAQRQQKIPPYTNTDITALIHALPKLEIENFIQHSTQLLNTLHDRVLVEKIIEIVQFLITRMKKRPHLFSKAEIKGMEMGREIIEQGNLLFDQLNPTQQNQIFELIIQVERDFLGLP